MNEKPKTIQEELDFEFDRAVDKVIHENFPKLSAFHKHMLLGNCTKYYHQASAGIVATLFATHVFIEAAEAGAPQGPRWTGCPGCGAGKGWIAKNPALHEQECGGIGKNIWERKGIQQ